MKMSVDQLALEVTEDLNMTKKDAKAFVTAVFECVAENMEQGHEINVPGFGKFRRKDKAARTGRNPKTGENIEIPAKSVPNFLPAKQLKERCNGGA